MEKKSRFQRIRKLAGRGKNYGRSVLNAEQIENEWGNIKDMAGAVLKPNRGPRREETFDNAVNRLGLSEEDIASSYKFHVWRAYIFLGGLALGFVLTVWFALTGKLVSSIACLGFDAVAAALFFQASFRSLQIRRRELVDVSFWLREPTEWIPSSPTLPRRKPSKSNLPATRSSSKSARTRK